MTESHGFFIPNCFLSNRSVGVMAEHENDQKESRVTDTIFAHANCAFFVVLAKASFIPHNAFGTLERQLVPNVPSSTIRIALTRNCPFLFGICLSKTHKSGDVWKSNPKDLSFCQTSFFLPSAKSDSCV